MRLEAAIAEWVDTRPDWQKGAVARFCRNERLSAEDIARIADQLVTGTFPPSQGITATDIPGTSETGESVRLVAVADVSGVNALVPDQRLTFSDSGLTVIYGDNGSGKSGYARLIRQAVTARIKADLLGDVFAQEHLDQRASFLYKVGDAGAAWSLSDPISRDLSAVRFYDEECGDAYVNMASEISYRPSALTLLDRLSRACDDVQQELTRRLAVNAASRPELPLLANGTSAKTFLDAIRAETSEVQIAEATNVGPDHEAALPQKLQELARLQGSDPGAEKARLSQLAAHWATVKDHVDSLGRTLNAGQIEELRKVKTRALALRAAASIASAKTFDAEPLPGVGSAAWRALWEAAREYSTGEAYQEHDFPATQDGSVCVLCQQSLSRDGADRLARFEAFIEDTTSREADTVERALGIWREAMVELRTTPITVTTALGHLHAGGEAANEVENWIASTVTAADEAVEWIDSAREELPLAPLPGPNASIEQRQQALVDASSAVDATTFHEKVRVLKFDVAELQARAQLAAARANLNAEVGRLQERARIEGARRLTDTTGITRKATALTTEHVTRVVRDRFTRETELLSLRRVTLDPTGGRRDATLEHRPKLLGATVSADIDDVLSEGEQTALGLAGFITEVEFDDSRSAVVLDDPVSSLDAGRRSRVAKRLVELAQDRQVIVFTHEVTFVNALNRAARDLGVEVTERAILRQGERPGLLSDKHPWNVKDIPARTHWLGEELARLRRDRGQLDSDEYTRRAQEWGGRLSQAWERAVNLNVVNELVDRGTSEVRPLKFRMLVGITDQDNIDYQSGYAKASEWAPRHDQAPEVNFMAPEPDELEAELTRFKDWVERIKRYGR
jgi:energy-coupling factor transporter ATP-binding protein EcfA2